MQRSLVLLSGLALACGRPGEPPGELAQPAPELIRPEAGNVDAFGHVMLPAGAHASCEVHGVPLEDDVIAVLNGLPYIDTAGYSAAQRKEFPHDATLYYGGCMGDGSWASVSYCPACRAAELEWEQAAAAAGKKYSYDSAMRSRIREELERLGPAPSLPATR